MPVVVIEPPDSLEIVFELGAESATSVAMSIAPSLTSVAFVVSKDVLALIASVPLFVTLPNRVRVPPMAFSVVIVPLLVSVPAEIDERCVVAAAVSLLVSVIVPALVKLDAAVVLAFSL